MQLRCPSQAAVVSGVLLQRQQCVLNLKKKEITFKICKQYSKIKHNVDDTAKK